MPGTPTAHVLATVCRELTWEASLAGSGWRRGVCPQGLPYRLGGVWGPGLCFGSCRQETQVLRACVPRSFWFFVFMLGVRVCRRQEGLVAWLFVGRSDHVRP